MYFLKPPPSLPAMCHSSYGKGVTQPRRYVYQKVVVRHGEISSEKQPPKVLAPRLSMNFPTPPSLEKTDRYEGVTAKSCLTPEEICGRYIHKSICRRRTAVAVGPWEAFDGVGVSACPKIRPPTVFLLSMLDILSFILLTYSPTLHRL